MEELLIKVYIKINGSNCVVDCISSMFIKDTTDWVQIDEGVGNRYAQAQGGYFAKSLEVQPGIYQYKYIAETNTVEERTTEEIQADIDSIVNTTEPTAEERLAALESVIIGMLEI